MRDTIEMAREAKVTPDLVAAHGLFFTRIEHLVALARADERDRAIRENAYVLAEREACAKVCDEWGAKNMTATSIAEEIRARGLK